MQFQNIHILYFSDHLGLLLHALALLFCNTLYASMPQIILELLMTFL